ncbi:hypothetical protein [Actinomadura gamaensis]|uniref:Uncharacterized protein n=1 Tax=Actinomadura gamaensis TaxID=1763541 RepID=A0ABV9U6Y2_9ACTN
MTMTRKALTTALLTGAAVLSGAGSALAAPATPPATAHIADPGPCPEGMVLGWIAGPMGMLIPSCKDAS